MTTRSENRDFLSYRDEGSNEALARVFDAVAPRLLLLAAHLTPDAAQAEDLVQATFLHGMRDAQNYDGVRPVGAWLSGILNHRALDLRRRNALREHEPLVERAIDALGPAELVADQDFAEHVERAIAAIEAPYREVLMLRVVHGLEPTSIAHTLGRAPGTVRMQLKRGLERLREGMPKRSAFLSVFVLESGQGLEVIKENVLNEAAAATVVTATTIGVVGGFITMKIAAAAIVALIVSVVLFQFSDSPPEKLASRSIDPAPSRPSASPLDPESAPSPAPELRLAASNEARLAVDAEADLAGVPVTSTEFVVRVVYEADSAPATDVGVYVRALEGPALGRDARTNKLGRAVLSGLDDRLYTLHVDRLQAPIEFDAGQLRELEVTIPAGVRVKGRVVDLEGTPVVGARVLRLNRQHHDKLQVAAISGEGGRFLIRDVAGSSEFLARIDGFQPSELGRVRGKPGETDELELVLGARGHRLVGRVLDPAGDPVPHAWVALGVDEDAREELSGSNSHPTTEERTKAMDLEALLLRADENGRFETRQVPAGYVLAVARPVSANSGLVGTESLWIRLGDEAEITIRLEPGASIEGTVKDTDGNPVPGVTLETEWEGTALLGQMEDDIGPLMTDRLCVTAADGSFRLTGLLAGDCDVNIEDTGYEEWREELFLQAGELRRLDPLLERQAELAVQLLDAAGAPVVGWVVSFSRDGSSIHGGRFYAEFGSPTDVEGRRVASNLALDVAYTATVFAPNSAGLFNRLPAATRSDIYAVGDELVLQLSHREMSFGRISGRWLDAAGDPQRERRLTLDCAEGAHGIGSTTTADGSYEFQHVPAGAYRLSAQDGSVELGTFELGAGEDYRVSSLNKSPRAPGADR